MPQSAEPSPPNPLRSAAPIVGAVVLGVLVSLLCSWPGYVNIDVASQMAQGRSGVFFDWHPPFSSWLLGQLGREGQLVLNSLELWCALGVLAWLQWRDRPWRGAAAICVVGFSPAVLVFSGSLAKDLPMGGALIAGVAALAAGAKLSAGPRRRIAFGAAIVFAMQACLERHNAPPAIVPLCLWWAIRVWPRRARAKQVGLGLALWLVLVLASAGVQRAMTDKKTHIYQVLLLFDLMGITAHAEERVLPDYVIDDRRDPSLDLSVAGVKAVYNPAKITTLLTPRLGLTVDPEKLSTLRASWWGAICSHPLSYLAHRWAVTREALGLVLNNRPVPPVTLQHDGYVVVPGPVGRLFEAFQRSGFARQVLRPFIYLLLIPLTFAFCVRTRRDATALVLASSAVLYAGPYLVVGMASGFRYLWWSTLAALVLAVFRPGVERPSGTADRELDSRPAESTPNENERDSVGEATR